MVLKFNKNFPFTVGLMILLISNICFYTLDTMTTFLLLSALGMVLIFGAAAIQGRLRLHLDHCILWLTAIYTLFTVYGVCFLRYGTYNWDMMLFTYVENIALYVAFKNLLLSDNPEKTLFQAVIYATIFILAYILIMEYDSIVLQSMRIGDSLSGNVNTVGVSLGVLSLFITQTYCMNKRKSVLLLLVVTVAFMLITGSKKTLVFLAFDLLLFGVYVKGNKRLTTFMGIGIVAVIVMMAIMNVPQLYNIIGARIEDMFYELFGVGSGRKSNSTASRLTMIREGFQFFLENPIFGGGEKYFGFRSSTIYDYSHCNYTELLCNHGIIGAALYYVPYFRNIVKIKKCRNIERELRNFVLICIVVILLNDWMMVSYSSLCIFYIPIIFSFAVIQTNQVKGLEKS